MDVKIFDTPEGFYEAIPTELSQNIEFRKMLHTFLAKDKVAQKVYLALCISEPKIAFNSMFWCCDPRLPVGARNWPFILRKPSQEICVDTLKWGIETQHDIGINKCRDEGCTEMVTKTFALYTLQPDTYFVVGSRKEDLVDAKGDPYTLFAKIDFAFKTLPAWMDPVKNSITRTDMMIQVGATGSVIRGETTNESFSAGRRATAMFLDEFGRVEPSVAESIEGSVHDVTGCVIYGSTHWYGDNHAFAKALRKSTTKVVSLPWWDNPNKKAGLYKSPDYDIIEIVDKDYYLKNYPGIFNEQSEWTFTLSKLERNLLSVGYSGPSPRFVADACENIPGDVRSPWHDTEEERRRGNRRDFMSNVWASAIGASDAVFDSVILERIKSTSIRRPTVEGEIEFTYGDDGRVNKSRFIPNAGRKRLKWWGPLPSKDHNYVMGCDIALGTGESNSVAKIFDVNTNEEVGVWACPNTNYDLFADVVRAIALWCGGSTGEAYVVFENNGGHGTNFGRRLVWNGHSYLYTSRAEDAKVKKQKNRYGWNSTPNTKSDMLGQLGVALSEGLKTKPTYSAIIIHDEETLNELRDYVFFDNGDMGTSSSADMTTGARKRHGDRVIASGLVVIGAKYQNKARVNEAKKRKEGTFSDRLEQQMAEREEERKHQRRELF